MEKDCNNLKINMLFNKKQIDVFLKLFYNLYTIPLPHTHTLTNLQTSNPNILFKFFII